MLLLKEDLRKTKNKWKDKNLNAYSMQYMFIQLFKNNTPFPFFCMISLNYNYYSNITHQSDRWIRFLFSLLMPNVAAWLKPPRFPSARTKHTRSTPIRMPAPRYTQYNTIGLFIISNVAGNWCAAGHPEADRLISFNFKCPSCRTAPSELLLIVIIIIINN